MKTRNSEKETPKPETKDTELRQVTNVLPLVCEVPCPSLAGSENDVNVNTNDARSVYLIAQLEEEQLMSEIELENQQRMLKARNKVRLAKLKMELTGSDRDMLPSIANEDVNKELSDKFLHNLSINHDKRASAPPQVSNHSYNCVDLPKVDLQSFDGNPCSYFKFVRQFTHYIEDRVEDEGQRLLYLVQYCEGTAKLAIENCCMLPPEIAYKKARQILEDLYGQSHIIARSMIENLFNGVRPLTLDGKTLTEFAVRMQGCEMALSQMGCDADLDAANNLERIVRLLPITLQRGWARIVDEIAKEGRHPRFQDLRVFIDEEARIARNRFGQLAFENETKMMRPVPFSRNEIKKPFEHRSSYAIQTPVFTRYACFVCSKPHKVEECSEFLACSIQARWNCLRKHQACFVCLNLGHRAAYCQSFSRCNISGCMSKHHPLLHGNVEADTSTIKTVNCSVANYQMSDVRLGVLPVCIRGPKGFINTFALLDNGSDVSIVERDLLHQVGVQTLPTSLTIATITAQKQSTRVLLRWL